MILKITKFKKTLLLVLEHVDWQKTIQNILNFGIKSLYVIIQKQEKSKSAITTYENVPESIIQFSKIAKIHSINECELEQYPEKEGFNFLKKYSEKVLNNKEMLGMYFIKNDINL